MDLTGREIVLGVTGGIAAYKSAQLVSRLRHSGANVHVIMTKNATEFVSPLTFQTLSANQVVTDTFQAPEYWNVEHVALAKLAEVFVIAPATANILAKMAAGIADDMLSTTVLATKAPVLVAPAMNTGMWTAEATRENVKKLADRGVHFVGPDSGILACGDEGAGRMSEPEAILAAIEEFLNPKRDLAGLKVLVTAGATRERLDPVRFITNDSSGKMGFAIAEAARDRGADVTVVYGSVTAPVPENVNRIAIESARDLYEVMMRETPAQDIVIQAAAVCDYRFEEQSSTKIKKEAGKGLTLTMTENPDVSKAVGEIKKEGQTLVGFAAETDHLLDNAQAKLKKKNLDMIVANDVTKPGAGFNVDTNIATLITKNGMEEQPMQTKRQLADVILDRILQLRA